MPSTGGKQTLVDDAVLGCPPEPAAEKLRSIRGFLVYLNEFQRSAAISGPEKQFAFRSIRFDESERVFHHSNRPSGKPARSAIKAAWRMGKS